MRSPDMERIKTWWPEEYQDEIFEGMRDFPARLAKLAAGDKYFNDEGPFPIRHNAMQIHNVLINKDFGVTSVIDWHGASALPWGVMDCPGVVTHYKPYLSFPLDKLDDQGQPKDAEVLERIAWQRAYAEMVREAELEVGADHKLSDTLADRDVQDLASACHYFDEGHTGLYGQLIKYFEDK